MVALLLREDLVNPPSEEVQVPTSLISTCALVAGVMNMGSSWVGALESEGRRSGVPVDLGGVGGGVLGNPGDLGGGILGDPGGGVLGDPGDLADVGDGLERLFGDLGDCISPRSSLTLGGSVGEFPDN